jgi:hypothetical protein
VHLLAEQACLTGLHRSCSVLCFLDAYSSRICSEKDKDGPTKSSGANVHFSDTIPLHQLKNGESSWGNDTQTERTCTISNVLYAWKACGDDRPEREGECQCVLHGNHPCGDVVVEATPRFEI